VTEPIRAVGVVVPAHNEQELLAACLASVFVAAGDAERQGLRVHVVCVLDSCTDGSSRLARTSGARTLEVSAGNVGVARRAGFAEVLRAEVALPPERLWLAMTDADSEVPRHWLTGQVAYANDGADVIAGTVSVSDWSEHLPTVAPRFAELYGPQDAEGEHPHVHGANLGVRASAYRAAGGLSPLALAEDHALVEACARIGVRVLRTRELPVTTSARRTGRARGGFADLLAGLAGRPTIT
jgi:glycosyltransferase involved in cell wall biosynthesis